GSLEALQQSTVAAQLGGNVLQLAVKAGDRVKAGQLLARIDERDAQAGLARSDAGAGPGPGRTEQCPAACRAHARPAHAGLRQPGRAGRRRDPAQGGAGRRAAGAVGPLAGGAGAQLCRP
ncbi:MAG: biotin/lipoyl-binding protein, partial [Comamonadaceae bacterium]|nr:biotin/lipoyl-binding protein [Comamonadaceae bacterium]